MQNQVVLISVDFYLHVDFFSATAPQCQTNDRVDCRSDENHCESKGCCYSPTADVTQPWCYHEKGKD